jgi:hypothetical protein
MKIGITLPGTSSYESVNVADVSSFLPDLLTEISSEMPLDFIMLGIHMGRSDTRVT